MKFLGIIPARYASTRFPAKPLAVLGGKTVIQRVYEQVAGILDDAYVATDDERIEAAVKAFGGKVVMTSTEHKSGTDRCQEACTKIGGQFDVVVNIQGDEPFIQPSQLQAVKACFDDPATQIATLVKPFTVDNGFEALENVNSPKVVLNKNRNALYFSRSIIPYQRNAAKEDWLKNHTYYKHRPLCLSRRGTERDNRPSAVIPRDCRIIGTASLVGKRIHYQSRYHGCRNYRHRYSSRFGTGRRIS